MTSPTAGARDLPRATGRRVLLLIVVGVGFALRLRAIQGEDLGLDGGLSLALGVLPLPDALQFLGHDVHPPLYYALLRLWLALTGPSPFAVKYLSAAFTTLAVAALAGWTRAFARERAALFAAAIFAFAPAAIEASANVREYALAIVLIVLVGWSYTRWSAARFILFGALALWTSYLAAGVVAAAAVDSLVHRSRRPRFASILLAGASILPWLAYAFSIGFAQTLNSAGPRGGPAPSIPLLAQLGDLPRLLTGGALLQPEWLAPALTGAALAVVVGTFLLTRTAGGVDRVASNASFFAMAAVASIALALAVNSSWTREGLAARYVLPVLPLLLVPFAAAADHAARKWKGAIAAVALVVLAGALGTRSWLDRPIPPKSFWDADGLVRYLDQHATAADAIVFDSPEQAGYYQALSDHPRHWVLVPVGTAYLQGNVKEQARTVLAPLVSHVDVVWLVLLHGSLGAGSAKIVGWLSFHAFSVTTSQLADSDVAPFIGRPPAAPARTLNLGLDGGIDLVRARLPATARPGGDLPIELDWTDQQPLQRNLTVFVHLVDASGKTWAQHDTPPANGRRPVPTWLPGQDIFDLHGLIVPADAPAGSYWIELGLYDANGRLPLVAGGDTIRLGPIEVGKG